MKSVSVHKKNSNYQQKITTNEERNGTFLVLMPYASKIVNELG